MDLLEFQAKELLSRFDIPIPASRIAEDAEDAEKCARRLQCDRFVVKAQVRAGERREAGGIRFAASPEGVRATAELLLGQRFLTKQMQGRPQTVRWLLIEQAIYASRLLFAAVVLDRASGGLVLLTSRAGGEGIETRAVDEPGLITRTPISIDGQTARADFDRAARAIELSGPAVAAARDVFQKMAQLAVELDAPQVEINPLALTPDGRLIALDAKISVDGNALFRHPALAQMKNAFETETGETEELGADRHQLNYMAMDGDIGIVANGAGLALASLDLVMQAGGRPANFMDIRTTASSLDIAYGLSLILANPQVRAILVNVHGGGMQRCDTIAEGVAVAVRKQPRAIPIIVRLAGNNADFARTRLSAAGVAFREASDMAHAAAMAVAASRSGPA